MLLRRPSDVVVIKPAGLASEVSRNPAADSLVARVRAEVAADARLVHRLDTPARGVMLVALTPEASAYYGAEIAAGRWEKWYLARIPRPDEVRRREIVGPHLAHLKQEGRRSRVVRAGGKPSRLDIAGVWPAPARAGEAHALVRLETGRFHQIRVMLADLGAPLVGDTLYGGTEGPFYLEQCVLGVRLLGDTGVTRFGLVEDPDREPLDPALAARVADLVAGRA
jgi:23S rRNA-/tRNA-specific pseudouridylate synthase